MQVDDIKYKVVVKPSGAVTLVAAGRPKMRFASKAVAYRELKQHLDSHHEGEMVLSVDNDVLAAAFRIIAKLQTSMSTGKPLVLRRAALKQLVLGA